MAFGDSLISAVAVAFSPFPIVAVVLVLGTPRARLSGLAFAVGWVVGLTAVSVIAVLLLGDADEPGQRRCDRGQLAQGLSRRFVPVDGSGAMEETTASRGGREDADLDG